MGRHRHSKFTLWRKYLLRTLPLLGPTPRRIHVDVMREPRSIILEKRDNIGDFVLATTFFNEAYRRWRGLDVTLVCSPAVQMLARALYPEWQIRVVPVSEAPEHYRGSWRKPGELQKEIRNWPKADLLLNLRSIRHQYEIFFDSWVPATSKLAVRNQFHYQEGEYIKVPDRRVYSHLVEALPHRMPTVCRDIANHRSLLRNLFPEVNTEETWPALNFGVQAKALEEEALLKGRLGPNCLMVVPFPSRSIRRYPEKKLQAVVSTIAQKHEWEIAVLGGPGDWQEAEAFVAGLSAPKGAKNLAGILTVPELAVTIGKAALVVGVDTGPMHIAVACGVPTVVLLGGGHYGTFGPWGDPGRAQWLSHPMPCYNCSWLCSQAEPFCVRSIGEAAILEAAESVLRTKGRPAVSS